jgi:hypothetical protein
LSLWSRSLREKLRQRESDYVRLKLGERRAEDDPDALRVLATTTAGLALLEIVTALKQLDAFADNAGLAPLHDLSAALHHLTEGGKPPMLQPAVVKGDLSEPLALRYVKRHAVAAIELLLEAGLMDAPARRLVAKTFADAGFLGRKGHPLSAGTLFDWCQDVRENEHATSQVSKLRTRFLADRPGRPTVESVSEWLRWALSRPLMQTKI